MRVDLHLHTTASDGTDTPATLVKKAWEKGIKVISVTDHDTVAGIPEARAALSCGMTLIEGVEFSSVTAGDGGFRCHILGYGIDVGSEAITHAIDEGMKKRREKLYARLGYIEDNFGIRFPVEDVRELEGYNAVSKLHIAKLLIKYGHADNIGDAIDKYIGGNAPDDRIDAALAIDSIRAAGGVAVWAHPIGGEREPRIDAHELYRRAGILREMGVIGLEAYYSRYTEGDRAPILAVAEELSMVVTGGSDYHGENKTVPLGCLDADGREIDSRVITFFDLF